MLYGDRFTNVQKYDVIGLITSSNRNEYLIFTFPRNSSFLRYWPITAIFVSIYALIWAI